MGFRCIGVLVIGLFSCPLMGALTLGLCNCSTSQLYAQVDILSIISVDRVSLFCLIVWPRWDLISIPMRLDPVVIARHGFVKRAKE